MCVCFRYSACVCVCVNMCLCVRMCACLLISSLCATLLYSVTSQQLDQLRLREAYAPYETSLWVSICLCVCKRERERERESSLRVYVSMWGRRRPKKVEECREREYRISQPSSKKASIPLQTRRTQAQHCLWNLLPSSPFKCSHSLPTLCDLRLN